MLTKVEFLNKVVEELKEYYGNDAEVSTQEVLKTNDVKYVGIVIRYNDSRDNNFSPVIYIDPYYKDYREGEEINFVIENITRATERCKAPSGMQDIVEGLASWAFCKNRVYPILISTERNQELLMNLVSKELLDLSIIYAVRLGADDDGMATVKVTYDLLKTWDVSLEELHRIAVKNMQGDDYILQDMKSIISEILDEDDLTHLEETPGSRMMVMSCRSKMYATAGVLDFDFMEKVTGGNSFYMIPSSIHEWIMIPESDDICVEELNIMIQEVNETQVSSTEILSDHAYKYCNGTLMCA